MKRVLITGSSGEIGSALVQSLLRDKQIGHIVGVDVRRPVCQVSSSSKLHLVQADVCHPIDDLLRKHSIDTVVHGAFVVQPMHNNRQAHAVDVGGTRNVLCSAAAAKVQTFVHLSSATVYGCHPAGNALFTEESPLRPGPDFIYAKHKIEAERIAGEFRRSGAFPTLVVLRPSFVAGPRSWNALFRHLCKAVVPLPSTQSPLQLVQRDDLTEIIRLLLHLGVNGTFNVGGDGGLTATQMVERLWKRPILIPDRLLTAGNSVAWNARLSCVTEVPSAALALLRYPWRVSTDALRRALGFSFRYSSAEAFASFAEPLLRKRSMQRSRL